MTTEDLLAVAQTSFPHHIKHGRRIISPPVEVIDTSLTKRRQFVTEVDVDGDNPECVRFLSDPTQQWWPVAHFMLA